MLKMVRTVPARASCASSSSVPDGKSVGQRTLVAAQLIAPASNADLPGWLGTRSSCQSDMATHF